MRGAIITAATFAISCLLTACPQDPDGCSTFEGEWPEEAFDAQGFLRCEVTPELCNLPVESVMREPDLDRAIDIVIVPDGYPASRLPLFQAQVRGWIDALDRSPDSIIGRDPSLFNFHVIEIISDGSQRYRPLRSCTRYDTGITVSDPARRARVALNAPDADVILVVTDDSEIVYDEMSYGGMRDSASLDWEILPYSHLSRSTLPETLDHELGHSLIGLGDEYVDAGEAGMSVTSPYVARRGNPLPPNVSYSPEGDWNGLVEGAFEGAFHRAHGYYRPSENCRMRETRAAYCPVCSDAIHRALGGHRGVQDGPPQCGVASTGPAESWSVFGRDGNGIVDVSLTVDGRAVPASGFRWHRPHGEHHAPRWFSAAELSYLLY